LIQEVYEDPIMHPVGAVWRSDFQSKCNVATQAPCNYGFPTNL